MGCALAIACVLGSVDAIGAPSPPEKAAARSLFDQGRALVKAGKYDQACPKFEESYKLDPGIGASFNLADCYERVGKTASAWSGFLEAASFARIAGQAQREKVARDRAKDLEPRLSRIVIEVAKGSALDGLEVRRDGTSIGEGVWGQGVPVDPGEHVVEAAAPGRKPWRTSVVLAGDGTSVTVTVPLLAPDREATAAPIGPAQAPLPPRSEATTRGKGQRTAGLVTAGVGLLSLGVAGVFALQTRSKVSDAEAWCDGANCWDPRGVDLHDQAKGTADLATVFGIVGAAAVAGGAVLYLTAPRAGAEPSARRSTTWVAGPMSLAVRGVW